MRQFSGFYPAVVIDNVDPDNSGRVKVRIPQISPSGEKGYDTWARIATLMAGNNRGSWFVPDVGDEVLIAFEEGDKQHSYVIGGLWSSSRPPPETMDTNNNTKLLCSRNGVKMIMDDQSGQESFIVETPGGQKLTLKDGPGSVEITDSNGNSVKLENSGITINASAKVTINGSVLEVNAGVVSVNSSFTRFNGAVQCDTLISNSVISASYTPGAGNIW